MRMSGLVPGWIFGPWTLNTLSEAKIVVSIASWQLPGLPTSDPALPDIGVFTGERWSSSKL